MCVCVSGVCQRLPVDGWSNKNNNEWSIVISFSSCSLALSAYFVVSFPMARTWCSFRQRIVSISTIENGKKAYCKYFDVDWTIFALEKWVKLAEWLTRRACDTKNRNVCTKYLFVWSPYLLKPSSLIYLSSSLFGSISKNVLANFSLALLLYPV